MLQFIKKKIKEITNQSRFTKNFIYTYLTYLIGFASILQAHILYKTDWTRAAGIVEASNWRHSGRIINDILNCLFNFSFIPQNVAPLTQLLSILFLTIGSIILVQVICRKVTYRSLLLSVIIGLCPYYLQVMSYVFDSVHYSLATLMAIIPFLFYQNNRVFYTMSAICVAWCLMSFQATISIYMIIVTYLFYRDYQENKIPVLQILSKIGVTTGIFLLVGLLYYFCVHQILSQDAAAIFQSELCQLNDCADVFVKNFRKATLKYFYKHWENTLMGWTFLMCFLSFTVFQIKQGYFCQRKTNKIINILVSLMPIIIMPFFIGLWTMFFTFIYWNARIWVGTGVCLGVMLLAMRNEKNKYLRRIFYAISIILVWGCIVFANRVGNLLNEQNKYVTFKITTMSQDLASLPVKGIKFTNRTIHSPVVITNAKEYPILGDLVSGIQLYWRRFRDYYFGFYRPDLHGCTNNRIEYNRVLINNPHHKMTQINPDCIEIEIK